MDQIIQYCRSGSLWPLTFGLACCAMEHIMSSSARFDLESFGALPRASPRHTDVMFVSGTVTHKMAPALRRLYEEMPVPRYVISMGSCSNSGGYYHYSYSVVKGVDKIIPCDVYVPGCPPTGDSLIYAFMLTMRKMREERPYYHYLRK